MRTACAVIAISILSGCKSDPPPQASAAEIKDQEELESRYAACKSELMKVSWVKDVHYQSGHFNVGVLRHEKDWSSPMVARFVYSIIAKHKLKPTWIRFVDIEKVVYQKKDPRTAALSSFDFAAFN